MNYLEFELTIQPNDTYVSDLLASYLGEIGFESFEETAYGLLAYVENDLFDKDIFENLLKNFPYTTKIEYKQTVIEQVNWNEEWEKNYFEPIVIGDKCVIRSSFHQNYPTSEYEIIIDPKMSFGTGHHETTSLMIAEILQMELKNKSVLDMGCGTAVLAILASMCGAKPVVAIDIDPWCTENSIENIEKNGVEPIEVLLGGAELLSDKKFDIIIANINRNILLTDIKKYSASLNEGGALFMSGFYLEDIPIIEKEANDNGLVLTGFQQKNNWVVVKTIPRV